MVVKTTNSQSDWGWCAIIGLGRWTYSPSTMSNWLIKGDSLNPTEFVLFDLYTLLGLIWVNDMGRDMSDGLDRAFLCTCLAGAHGPLIQTASRHRYLLSQTSIYIIVYMTMMTWNYFQRPFHGHLPYHNNIVILYCKWVAEHCFLLGIPSSSSSSVVRQNCISWCNCFQISEKHAYTAWREQDFYPCT